MMIWELMSTFDMFLLGIQLFFLVFLQQKLSDFGGEFGGWHGHIAVPWSSE